MSDGVWAGLLDGALDLLFGESCVGCGSPGRLLCGVCTARLPAEPFPAWAAPVPQGLAQPWAAASYDGTVRAMVLGLKEHQLLALVRPLGGLLAGVVAAGATAVSPDRVSQPAGPLVLVPVPSRRATVRARGHDPTRAVCVEAARQLRRRGWDVRVAPVLRVSRRVRDQSGLDAAARAANLSGSMRCSRVSGARLRWLGPGLLVVCDDVLTTGSTVREAQRALAGTGLPVALVAVVAATALRHPASRPTLG